MSKWLICNHLVWRHWCLSASLSRAPPVCLHTKARETAFWEARLPWQPMARIRPRWQWFYSVHRPSAKSSDLKEKQTRLFQVDFAKIWPRCAVQMAAHLGVHVHQGGEGYEFKPKDLLQCLSVSKQRKKISLFTYSTIHSVVSRNSFIFIDFSYSV